MLNPESSLQSYTRKTTNDSFALSCRSTTAAVEVALVAAVMEDSSAKPERRWRFKKSAQAAQPTPTPLPLRLPWPPKRQQDEDGDENDGLEEFAGLAPVRFEGDYFLQVGHLYTASPETGDFFQDSVHADVRYQ